MLTKSISSTNVADQLLESDQMDRSNFAAQLDKLRRARKQRTCRKPQGREKSATLALHAVNL